MRGGFGTTRGEKRLWPREFVSFWRDDEIAEDNCFMGKL